MANRGPTFFAKALSRYFFEYLPSERGLSQETIQSYRDAMSLLLDFCERERKIRRDMLTSRSWRSPSSAATMGRL